MKLVFHRFLKKVTHYSFFIGLYNCLQLFIYILEKLLFVAKLIDEARKPIDLESMKMKRAKSLEDPHVGPQLLEFLEKSSVVEVEGRYSGVIQGRSSIFRPAWGF